jgi:tol-pal system protein YbgF
MQAMQIPMIARRFVQTALVLGFAAGCLAGPAAPAFAQSKKDLQEQIDRLQRDLMDVERLIYRGGTPPSAGGEGAQSTSTANNQFADIQVHFNSIEDQLRSLTGQLESTSHQIQVLSDRLDKLQQDVEFRLNALEGHGQPAGTSPTPAPGAPSGQSGQLTPPPGAQPTQQTADTGTPEALPTGAPEVVYDHALGALRAGDYAEAERGFKGIIARNPGADLAANAQYWLGETYYVRKMYNDAASAFLNAYQKYPKGPKRPDSLLKLGMSLKSIGQKSAACDSFSELLSNYPMASKAIRSRAQSEQKDAGCT